jgi:acetolactate synthase-1/2/3 large subunit
MRVVDAMADWFAAAGITHYFGYAGGAIWPIMDALIDHPEIKGIQAKHESHAVHQADIYFRETGRIAPVIVTKGPGLMNAVGGIASAMHDSVPLLVISGGTATHFMGKAGMQEMYYHGHEDAVSVMRPLTKGAWMVIRPETVIDTLNQAYKLAVSGRPGPVFVQLPTDIQNSIVEGPIIPPSSREVRSGSRVDPVALDEAAALVRAAKRPLILAGGGLVRSKGGAEALSSFTETYRVPVATTVPAKGMLDEAHELAVGPVGRSGTWAAADATRGADLIVALGARFSDNNAGNWRKGAIYDTDETKIIQVDLAIEEIGRNYDVTLGLQADAGGFLRDLGTALGGDALDIESWRSDVAGFKAAWAGEIERVTTGDFDRIHPGRLSHEVGEALRRHENTHLFVDIGDIDQYAEPYLQISRPGSWHISSGMAEMGWASEGAPGAAVAKPGLVPIALTGDGAFLMGPQVLATAIEYGLPTVWVIINNKELGIEKKGAGRAFGRNHPWIFFRTPDGEPYNPDFVALARAFGGDGERVEKAEDLASALDRAIASGKPYVLDVDTDPDVASYFTTGLDRAYPDNWYKGYGAQGQLGTP